MPTLVVSAVNLVEGGTLTVLRDCLEAATRTLGQSWRIVALVHDPALAGVAGVEYVTVAHVKRSWLRRVDFEYRKLRKLSREWKADLWLSLHDMTPMVTAARQAVYCHNPSPFYRASLREGWQDPKFFAFTLFYGRLYSINIGRNDFVVVQQQWLRDAFCGRYGLAPDRVVVARPAPPAPPAAAAATRAMGAPRVFVYPTLPRPFKNVELVGEAVRRLEADPRWDGEVRVTIGGGENRYARFVRGRYGGLRSLRLIGRQTQAGMERLYREADCLLWPSKLETWGMPITEAKGHGLPMIVADLPYAYETVGTYDRAAFTPANDPQALAELMLAARLGEDPFGRVSRPLPKEPFAPDWPSLIRLLTAELEDDAAASPV